MNASYGGRGFGEIVAMVGRVKDLLQDMSA
ncbi:hypothetical protein BN2476_970013 [Paraburkholderia piptadeniae]|uniref:Uncharacterized protein n=1 Tax=Paraburkholderia piptadeniae TaxID=1701573 RepID=A0A1N7SUD9_9BURK|nr:hypothetical protein BN2476_970013 [Paraburkholderia piptadeniae]